jgi:DNA-directed RNA polymerase specialized sigma24 family protein
MTAYRPANFDARLLSYRPLLIRMATRYGEPADREDLVQSALARAMEKWLDCRDGFAAWLRGVMLAEIQMYRTARRPRKGVAANDNTPATQEDTVAAAQAISRCRNPDIMIQVGMGATMQDIAASRGISKQAVSVKVRADRARLAA